MLERKHGWPEGLALLGSVGGALAAQSIVTQKPYEPTGWLAYCAAGVLLVVVAGRWKPVALAVSEPSTRPLRSKSLRLLLGGAAVAVVAAATASSSKGTLPTATVLAWLLGLLVALSSARAWNVSGENGVERWMPAEAVALGAILVLAGAARFSWIDALPGRYFDDEARLGMYVLRTWDRGVPTFFNLGWNSWPLIGIFVQGSLGLVTELSTTTLRLVSASFGTLAVATTYLAARRLFSPRVALLAALLLAINRTAIDISRLGTSHAQVLALAPLAFALWWSGINSGKAARYLAGGIVMGLCMYTYNAGQLVVVVWLSWSCIAAPSGRLRRAYRKGAALTAAGFVLTVVPLTVQVTDGFQFGQQWREWLSIGRGRQVAGEIAGHLRAEDPGKALEIVSNQASANWLGFFVIPSHAYELGYRGGGISDDTTAALFFLGLALCLGARFGSRGAFLLWWWGLTTLLGGVLTRDPPVFQRLVGALPAVAILAALPLERLLAWAQASRPRLSISYAAIVALAAVAAWQNWRTYFVEFAGQPLDFTSLLARTIEQLPPDRPVILAGSEYAWHASGWQQHQLSFQHELFRLNFRDRELHEVGEPAQLLPLRYPVEPPPTLILGPTQIGQIDYVRTLYPEARIRKLGDDSRACAIVDLATAGMERATGLRLQRVFPSSAVDVGVADPLSPPPDGICPSDDLCELEWSGRIYWPADSPLQLRVAGDGLREVSLAGSSLPLRREEDGVLERIELPRGWHPLLVRQEMSGAGSFSIKLYGERNSFPLTRGDFSPDEHPHGLLATYSRDGRPVARSIDSQLNCAADERLFSDPRDLPFRMPFEVRWEGMLFIDRPGLYQFHFEANSRSSVELDGQWLLGVAETPENKTVETKSALQRLDAGSHPIIATWDAGPPYPPYPRAIFQLSWIPPDGELQLIPPTNFIPAAAPIRFPDVPPGSCLDDCSRDGTWTVDEIVRVGMIALGLRNLEACPRADRSGDHQITVEELVSAVDKALNGCR